MVDIIFCISNAWNRVFDEIHEANGMKYPHMERIISSFDHSSLVRLLVLFLLFEATCPLRPS